MIPAPAPPPPKVAEVAVVHLPHGRASWRVINGFDSAAECLVVLPQVRLLMMKGRLTFEAFYCLPEPLHPVRVFREPSARAAMVLDGAHQLAVAVAPGYDSVSCKLLSRDEAESNHRYPERQK